MLRTRAYYCEMCDEWFKDSGHCNECGMPLIRLKHSVCADCGGGWTFDFIAKRVYCKTCDAKTVTQ